ncbi:MAG: Gfo/Idh/MocA family oxidoreductase [Clostridia bacterium]|nr:Gfo/Idh/MocA family oxidoreductase [Clostridia bacterium]
MSKEIRIGVMGMLRGSGYVSLFKQMEGCRVTAVCDFNPVSLERGKAALDDSIRVFTDFDSFIDSGLFDAVMLCNFFFEHVPFALRAMERGIHVLSECTPALTLAECVQLCEAVERTGCKYMLAENYPYFACNLEMARRFARGDIGRALFTEGEYNHPVTVHDKNMLAPGLYHWRNWLPRSYYLTHSLSPIMAITGATPVAVNAKNVFSPEELKGSANRVGDSVAVLMVEMDDGSISRLTGCAAWGGHGNWYRICGTRGNMENVRGSLDRIRVQYNGWQIPEGQSEVNTVQARYSEDEDLNRAAAGAGHGGGDYFVAYDFLRYLRGETEPMFDVYRCVSMSATAVLAHRSAIEHGRDFRIPDFRDPASRKVWLSDTASPFPDADGHATMPCSSHPDFAPTAEDIANAEKEWKEAGLI